MQLAQDEGPAQTNSQECTPLPRYGSGRLLMSRYKSKFDYIGKLKKCKTAEISAASALNSHLTQRTQRYAEGRREGTTQKYKCT